MFVDTSSQQRVHDLHRTVTPAPRQILGVKNGRAGLLGRLQDERIPRRSPESSISSA
jgi:hypothetical protein